MIIQHEFQSEINSFITQQNKRIVDSFRSNGEWLPQFTFLSYNHKTKTFSTKTLLVPPQVLDSGTNKNLLFEVFFPLAVRIINEQEGSEVICVNWTTEIWLRLLVQSNDSNTNIRENWQDLPRRDCVFSLYETKVSQYGKTWEVETTSNQVVDSKGRLTNERLLHDFNELPEEGASYQGRFTHFLKQQPSFN